MAIAFPDEAKKRARASIRQYCAEKLDLDIGDLKADLLLDYFLRELAPTVYNAAVSDAQTWLRDRVADVEGVCYEPEFGYWPKASGPRPTA